jgi:hypothetical protein
VTIVKFLLGLVSASLLSAGLVAAAPAATAAPYPNTIDTSCSADGNRNFVKVRVRADGNREPRGEATIRIAKGDDVVRKMSVNFNGGDYSRTDISPRLGKGRYTVTVKANPSNDAFRNCSDSFRLRVR